MNAITHTWRVGRRYRVEATIGTDDAGVVRFHGEWSPRVPTRLTEREIADYRRGRDALAAQYAERAGIANVVIVEA